jgi:deoxyribodipyrimidine photo-lyase
MISLSRLRQLNEEPVSGRGDYVLYWMQASQRTDHNPALEHAITRADELSKPLLVAFGLMDDYPEANQRHYAFMVEGLRDVAAALAERNIRFVVTHGHPADVAIGHARRAAMVVCDRGYLRHQKAWRAKVALEAGVLVEQVEGDVVVPVEKASNKLEFAARTIRPKIMRAIDEYLIELPQQGPRVSSLSLQVEGDIDVRDPAAALARLKLDRSVGPSPAFVGGQVEGRRRMEQFVTQRLAGYAEGRNEPADARSSMLSPYLHFGQLSPVRIALAARAQRGVPPEDLAAFIEELVVRRELSMNHCHFNDKYDDYDGLPPWSRATLREHAGDEREVTYTDEQLASAQTHDRYWNAAQKQMNLVGYMHNYMRMYWGKKILEWSQTPQQGYQRTLRLNNRLFIDGRDPNGFVGVAWTYGTHDRPWGPARKIFGTVRYMAASGLERKFDIDRYVQTIDELERSLARR